MHSYQGLIIPAMPPSFTPCTHVFSQTKLAQPPRAPGILCPFQLGSARALFSYTLRIPALGHEAGLWEEERAGERRGMGPDYLLIALLSDIVLFP